MAKCNFSKFVRLVTLVGLDFNRYDSANTQKINEDKFRVNALFVFRSCLIPCSIFILFMSFYWGAGVAFPLLFALNIACIITLYLVSDFLTRRIKSKSNELAKLDALCVEKNKECNEANKRIRILEDHTRGVDKLLRLSQKHVDDAAQGFKDLEEYNEIVVQELNNLKERNNIVERNFKDEIYQSILKTVTFDFSTIYLGLSEINRLNTESEGIISAAAHDEISQRRLLKLSDAISNQIHLIESAFLSIRSGKAAVHLGGHDTNLEDSAIIARDCILECARFHGIQPRVETIYGHGIYRTTRLFHDRHFFPTLTTLLYGYAKMKEAELDIRVEYEKYNKDTCIIAMYIEFLGANEINFDKKFSDAYYDYRMEFQVDRMDEVDLHPALRFVFNYCAYYSIKMSRIDGCNNRIHMYRKINICHDDAHAKRFRQLREDYSAAGVFYVVNEDEINTSNVERIKKDCDEKGHTFEVIRKEHISYHLISATYYIIFDYSLTSMERIEIYKDLTENSDFDRVQFLNLGASFDNESPRIINVENINELTNALM